MLKRYALGFAIPLALVSLACSLPFQGGSPEEATTVAGEGDGALGDVEATVESGTQPGPTPTIDVPLLPVPLNQGLASLNSYTMTYTNDVYDSVADERSIITFVVARNDSLDASYNSTETQVTTEDYQVESDDLQEQFFIGNQVCVLSDGEAEFSTMSDVAREMMGLAVSQVVQFNPLIEEPEYVGEDVINGVPVHTYIFEVRSVEAASEAEVAQADGHYAIAVDGNYLVDYRLDMELRTAPEGDPSAEVSKSFFALKLEDINAPVEIALPASCLAAQ